METDGDGEDDDDNELTIRFKWPILVPFAPIWDPQAPLWLLVMQHQCFAALSTDADGSNGQR